MVKRNKGITLIALIITIIVLLILAGVTINLLVGDNGIFKLAQTAGQKYEQAAERERLEQVLLELQVDKVTNPAYNENEYIDNKIIENYMQIEGNIVTVSKWQFEIDRSVPKIVNELEIIPKEELLKPIITEIKTEVEETKITVNIELRNEDGTKIIYSIKEVGSTENIEITEEITELSHTFIGLQKDKQYEITIKTKNENGEDEKTIVEKTKKTIPGENSLIGAVKKIQDSGYHKIKVTGKTNEGKEEEINYYTHAIVYKGNLVLNGTSNVEGATLANNVYEFGDKTTDAGTEDILNEDGTISVAGYAKNMVVLKVEGDLTINEGVTLTACKSDGGYGGPKGMLIYCTGKITNNGTISMTARGAKAEGENVFLWENTDGTFEYVPALGGIGGDSVSTNYDMLSGIDGANGTGRQTRRRRLWKCTRWRLSS